MEQSNDASQDLRVTKTLAAIRTAFNQMILEMPYAKMTVAELARRAQINKKTFYRHFPTMDDLLRRAQLEYVAAYVKRIRNLRQPEDAGAITRTFLLFSCEQDKMYERITCDSAYDIIRDQMIDYVMGSGGRSSQSAAFGALPLAERSLVIAFTNVALVLYRQWVADGKLVTPERLAEIGAALVVRGTSGLGL
ncbi:TetR/AcrR family transcriptional regulator [Collinsella vaginalis]|uniref:TetR/AcrR family transcriptional regulator n=1 Tax=Collinsella vaginalis TaxID=1870987 RepID=UPI000A26E2EC|nr:TetR/AcrR family transcriptional regulator [Collinsella vaginalis]